MVRGWVMLSVSVGRMRFGVSVSAGRVLRVCRFQFGRQLLLLRFESGNPVLLLGQCFQSGCMAAEGFVDL